MLSTIERIIALKQTELFRELASDELASIAAIAGEVVVYATETLLEAGDSGDSLFIVVDGRMRVHRGDHTLATLGEHDPVGEMSVLARRPRSASVTAESDTLLLEISANAFNELMDDHPEIAQGVIRVLLKRVYSLYDALLPA